MPWCYAAVTAAVVACNPQVGPTAHLPPAHVAAHVAVVKHKPVPLPKPAPVLPMAKEDFSPAPVTKPAEFTPPPKTVTTPKAEKKKGKTMQFISNIGAWVHEMFAWAGLGWTVVAGIALWLGFTKGWPWLSAKLASFWNTLIGDVAGLRARVEAIEAERKPAPVVVAPVVVAPAPAPAPAAAA